MSQIAGRAIHLAKGVTNAGVVISAGKMQKTVTVRMAKEHYNKKLRKVRQSPPLVSVYAESPTIWQSSTLR